MIYKPKHYAEAKIARVERKHLVGYSTYARYAAKASNKAERKAAKNACRLEVGNSRPLPTPMGPYHAR